MSRVFRYDTTVRPDWIDYNGHMQDAYYGLVFSHAVDTVQDAVGVDAAYRARTGCTIFLLEDHKSYLREVKEGAALRVEMRVLDADAKRFHLHGRMFEDDALVAVGEFIELHVATRPAPHAAPMPETVQAALDAARLSQQDADNLSHRSRALALRR
ncbi:MAG: thioesterase [Alphaproteobacteria bacterium]|jgi:acyl-CoA thioester hydrolase|nr:thioesterase [Alphaproteobacteria bacterium]